MSGAWLAGVQYAANTLDASWWGERLAHATDGELRAAIADLVVTEAPFDDAHDASVWAGGYAHVAAEAVRRLRAERRDD